MCENRYPSFVFLHHGQLAVRSLRKHLRFLRHFSQQPSCEPSEIVFTSGSGDAGRFEAIVSMSAALLNRETWQAGEVYIRRLSSVISPHHNLLLPSNSGLKATLPLPKISKPLPPPPKSKNQPAPTHPLPRPPNPHQPFPSI